MSPKFARQVLANGSFLEVSIYRIPTDKFRPHGIRYRLAWIQNEKCRVLFDNHHGKSDHSHIDGVESEYKFTTIHQVRLDFEKAIERLGGKL